MRRIDLHTHTVHSDGTLTPAELVRLAVEKDLALLAVTDHDTTAGVPEATEAGAEAGLEIVTGVEISTSLDGTSVHVLAHGFPLGAPRLEALLEQVRSDREERNRRLHARLAELGCPLEPEEVERQAIGRIIARPHFARALVARGYVGDAREAFDRYLKDGGPAHVVVDRSKPEDAVSTIRASGGVATIAHPKQIGLPDRSAWLRFLGRMIDAGLVGLEVDHPSHKPRDRDYFGGIQQELGLVRSGGSDFHGLAKPGRTVGSADGTIRVGYEVWERLRERRQAPEPMA